MCGIAAIFAYRDGAPDVDHAELTRINERMFKRGPDAGHVWISEDRRVGLASRRLAIIDLTPEAEQPMFDASGELAVVFNGEIYNYRELRTRLEARGAIFRTSSDTEVLLHLYRRDGERMTELLRGMFAFAIWDARERRLFVARDPYGIKPLYVADDGATIRLASQVKALLAGGAIPATRDEAGIAGFFLTGSVPEPYTTFANIRAFEAGSSRFLTSRGHTEPRRYFWIADVYRKAREQSTIGSLAVPSRLVQEFIAESVGVHLESDVPVGAFLSAGVDSSAIVAQGRAVRDLRAITVRFDVFRDSDYDEVAAASRFAADIDVPHTVEDVTREDFVASLPQVFDDMDQPTIDGVNTWFVSRAAAAQGLKVALSGLGGDEMFGSYPSFREVPKIVSAAETIRRVPGSDAAFRAAAGMMRRLGRGNPKLRGIPQLGTTWGGAWLVKRGLFLPTELHEVLPPGAVEQALANLDILAVANAPLDPDPGSPFGRVATLESSLYMRNQLLRDTDWASMAHSIEVRTPLVDAWLLRQLAPLLLTVGPAAKTALGAHLPSYLNKNRKLGFVTPIAAWAGLPEDRTSTRMRGWARTVFEKVY